MALTFHFAEAMVQISMGKEKEVDEWLPECYKLSRVPRSNFKTSLREVVLDRHLHTYSHIRRYMNPRRSFIDNLEPAGHPSLPNIPQP